ncbi:MAG: acetyl/propionyl/methylcrotonyl-CoA carboxylase subunit alpha [Rhizobiaceae bacterium]
MKQHFSKILIANRGEIACRIMRTAKRLGVATVAVYSDADANAMHVMMADEAVRIGEAPVGDSYLKGDVIIEAALATGAQAIHPGYGFLSENPNFVEAVEKAGLVFIGPSASAIRAMGLKDAAKKLMSEAGVPVVPGYHGSNQDAKFLANEAEKIGYPVLIKARAGGGGKGMRLVERSEDFPTALEGASREGEASFGDGHVLIEKYITSPRHIEIQVFGDNHGNVVHLFERDCSLQRRHQKVIEEAPAPGMTEAMRTVMGDAAVKAAKTINYSGAGTIEFIVDSSDGLKTDAFWFMEMNTRLQVEHPVTEFITGQDLVEWQLLVANGELLPKKQSELSINGHAFEARIYAEDVSKGFLPATGKLEYLRLCVIARNDSGVREGDIISPFYDPMIAKVVTLGSTRAEALARMKNALAETRVVGTVTNTAFLAAIFAHKGFASGQVDTGLIDRDLEMLIKQDEVSFQTIALAGLCALGLHEEQSPFQSFRHWGSANNRVVLELEGEPIEVHSRSLKTSGSVVHEVGEAKHRIEFVGVDGEQFICRIDGQVSKFSLARYPSHLVLFIDGGAYDFTLPDPLDAGGADANTGDNVIAPMPGLIKVVSINAGDVVKEGAALLVLEAMKMEHTLTAPRDGIVAEVNAKAGDQVEDGVLLVLLESVNE